MKNAPSWSFCVHDKTDIRVDLSQTDFDFIPLPFVHIPRQSDNNLALHGIRSLCDQNNA